MKVQEILKILAISHACVTDVNQQLFVELAQIRDNQIELVVPSSWKSEYSATPQSLKLLNSVSFPVHSFPVYFSGNLTLHYYKGALARIVRKFNPDVIFIDQEPWAFSTAQWLNLAKRFKKPVVIYTKQNIYKSYPLPFRILEKRCYSIVKSIMVINKETEDVLRKKGYTGPAPELAHGCDLSLFYPDDSTEMRKRLGLTGTVLGYMGRLVPDKGIDVMIKGAMKLREANQDISLLIVGSGELDESLRTLASSSSPSLNVVFTGSVPHREAGDYMRCMDIFVLCSRTRSNWKEQFGRVIVEAMACGVPVVGSDSGHIPVLIEQTEGGLVFKEDDIDDLKSKIDQLINNPDKRKTMGESGRQYVSEHFTHKAVAETLHTILCKAIK